MLIYYIKLSCRNFARNSLFFTLMITTLAVGVGVLLANLSILKSMASDPIPEKSDRVFNVSLNTWPNKNTLHEQPLPILRYQDAMHLLKSDIPTHSLVHYASSVYARDSESNSLSRFSASVRATTQGFFPLTDAPFAYGTAWQQPNALELVIGDILNQKLFGGGNSVGKNVEIDGKLFLVVGVLKPWKLKPKFYHASNGRAFNLTDDIFAPLEVALDSEWGIGAQQSSTVRISSSSDTRNKNSYYLQAFVQLDNAQQKASFQNYLDSYSQSLKDAGQHPLDINNKLYDVNAWLKKNNVVDDRMLAFGLATVLFLAVCIFNASSLLIARYHGAKFETGLRRAVGASRKDLFYQGVVESLLIGISCALLASVLSWIFLQLSISFFPHLEDIAEIDNELLLLGVVISVSTVFFSALYPLIRSCTTSLSAEIK
ncbi:MAG: ABC transporter permease [Alteromonadaceae bacterium]|nr:ABC transporter permease [Alteromonadaceae bacterium]